VKEISRLLPAFFAFNQAMNARRWNIMLQHVSDSQFIHEDGYLRASMCNQLVHMANAQYYWLRELLGDNPPGEAQ
jgi:uncharacterized damage-inducible protein DinB